MSLSRISRAGVLPRSGAVPGIGARVSVANGQTRISAVTSLPLDGAHDRRLPGYIKDHIRALDCAGPDAVSNMQWQTIADARVKDRWERKSCAR
jgi:hypothetical protein